jgi:hypothetical protein
MVKLKLFSLGVERQLGGFEPSISQYLVTCSTTMLPLANLVQFKRDIFTSSGSMVVEQVTNHRKIEGSKPPRRCSAPEEKSLSISLTNEINLKKFQPRKCLLTNDNDM